MHVFCILLSENHAVMIRYISQNQMSIEEFKAPFEIRLDKNNRWVKLGESIPWDALARIYYRSMSSDMGAPAIDARIVIGAMIIKHKLKLDDRETMETIRENMYMQYFLGLKEYVDEYVFDRSLFTTLRYRLGADKFDAMTRQIILRSEKKDAAAEKDLNGSDNDMTMNKLDSDIEQDNIKGNEGSDGTGTEEKSAKNKGKLIMDATVADQMIAYPTDLGLLSRSREESERLIDELCKELVIKHKPRTYRRLARKQYLNVAKKKNKSKKEIRKGVGQQLRYLRRNLKNIDKLLDTTEDNSFPLEHRDQRIFWVIQHIYEQQAQMYKEHTHSIDNRIVNIYQPYVRPIVRGKDKAQVEFGAKLGVSIQDGYARINTISWEAYNEGTDLKKQVEAYKKLNGCYPEVVITDKIYGTRENRQWLKDLGIRYSGKPLGRPSSKNQTQYRKRKQKIEQGIRNQVEGKFGQGKNGYNLNKVRARTSKTSESWIAAIFFVMNLIRFGKEFLFSFIKKALSSIFSVPDIFIWRQNAFVLAKTR
jgi:transposase, IS5 family